MASIKSMTLPEVKAPTLPHSEDTAENLVSKFMNMAADIDKKTASKKADKKEDKKKKRQEKKSEMMTDL